MPVSSSSIGPTRSIVGSGAGVAAPVASGGGVPARARYRQAHSRFDVRTAHPGSAIQAAVTE
jgi:hypothetical protein